MLAPLLLAAAVGSTPPAPAVEPAATPVAAPTSAGVAAPVAAPAEPDEWPGRPLIRRPMPAPTFLSAGLHYVSWTPISDGASANGGGLEVSLTRWLRRSSFVVGALGQIERVGRTRGAIGLEAGYDVVGLEVAIARDFAHSSGGASGTASDAQWSLQLASYVSIGAIYLSSRWLIPIARGGDHAPGYGALLAVGFKLPIVLGDGR